MESSDSSEDKLDVAEPNNPEPIGDRPPIDDTDIHALHAKFANIAIASAEGSTEDEWVTPQEGNSSENTNPISVHGEAGNGETASAEVSPEDEWFNAQQETTNPNIPEEIENRSPRDHGDHEEAGNGKMAAPEDAPNKEPHLGDNNNRNSLLEEAHAVPEEIPDLACGIQSSLDVPEGNIPASPNMMNDPFGVAALLPIIQASKTGPNPMSLALGEDLDLMGLGLNLNSRTNLFPTFGGPWANMQCQPQNIDFHVPPEYHVNHAIRHKLAPLDLRTYMDDALFFLFYTSVGDVLQIAAAAELYNREWRYHMEERVWISPIPGMIPIERTNTYERSTYYFFDTISWRKVPRQLYLEYCKLEGPPGLYGTGPIPMPM
ncbi:unnamed protein product [Ceutorhynchus assimilis]|uniref:NOT2/NOT3/NOT5 C-terminal domain-containing protein n=1 Tax=Ceutorhynchus assimilis TaxID=467358 RepID=A0A9P0GR88_9CUCU|nr:unnamed protein product [Ceutorhynchus assimilis]